MRHFIATRMTYHKKKRENVGLMDNYCVVGITVISYTWLGVLNNNFSKKDIAYHVTIGGIPHCTCPDKCHLNRWEEKGNWCIANIFIKCLNSCIRWITIVTIPFMLQCTPTRSSYGYLNLRVWQSNVPNVVFNYMFEKFNKWYVSVRIVIIKNKQWIDSFLKVSMIIGSLHSCVYQNASTLKLKFENTSTNYRTCTLEPWLFTQFGRYYYSLLTTRSTREAHVSPLAAHQSCLSFPQNLMKITLEVYLSMAKDWTCKSFAMLMMKLR